MAITGQVGLNLVHKESHQYADIVDMLRPVTKWNARIERPETVPEVVRKAFKLAEAERPGPTHLELCETIAAAGLPDATRPPAASHSGPSLPGSREPPGRDLGDPRGDGALGHPRVGRGRPQAVAGAPLPGLRAQHRDQRAGPPPAKAAPSASPRAARR